MIEKVAQLPGREKAGLALALVLVVLYIVDITVAKPLVRRLRKLDVEITVEEKRLNHNRKVVSFEDSVQTQYGAVKDLIGVSGTEQETTETFKNEIDEMAQRCGVRLKSMRHLTPERTAFLITYFIEISDFEADTPALINFLHGISQAPGQIRVRNLVVSSQGSDSAVNGSLMVTKVMTQAGDEGTL
jgi:hypothetical protein